MKKNGQTAAGQAPRGKKKRRVLRGLLIAALILALLVLLAAGAVFLYARYSKTHYEVTFYQETSKKVTHNIRLAVIADIHNREYGENNETLVGELRALKPDLILFAGDMVIRAQDDYSAALRLVERLSEVAPCYGVLGNHESERIYYHDDKTLPDKFEQAGLHLLRNAQETVRVGADSVQLIGVEGTSYGFEEYGGRTFMDGVTVDPNAYCVVMAHIPILFDDQLSDYDFDLGIAGHVHGGVVILPHFGGLYTDEEGFFPTYWGGRCTLKNQKPLILSRGLGDSTSPFPRINNLPELVVIDVNCY